MLIWWLRRAGIGRLIARDVCRSEERTAGDVSADGGKGEVAFHTEMSAAPGFIAFCENKKELSEHIQSLGHHWVISILQVCWKQKWWAIIENIRKQNQDIKWECVLLLEKKHFLNSTKKLRHYSIRDWKFWETTCCPSFISYFQKVERKLIFHEVSQVRKCMKQTRRIQEVRKVNISKTLEHTS